MPVAPVRSTESDGAGRYTIPDVPAGSYALHAFSNVYLATSIEVEVTAGTSLESKDLVPPPGAALELSILCPDEASPKGLWLASIPSAEPRVHAVFRRNSLDPIEADNKVLFHAQMLPAGELSLYLVGPMIMLPESFMNSSSTQGISLALDPVTLVDGETLSFEVDLRDR
ncbi:MAG: hypothetical protein ACI835_001093 [Planctomycetota bacterium]